jgi:hypothetical protein
VERSLGIEKISDADRTTASVEATDGLDYLGVEAVGFEHDHILDSRRSAIEERPDLRC